MDTAELRRQIGLSVNRVIAEQEHERGGAPPPGRSKSNDIKMACDFTTAVGLPAYSEHGFRNVSPTVLEAIPIGKETYRRLLDGDQLGKNDTISYLGPAYFGDESSVDPDGSDFGHVGLIVDGAIVDIAAGQMARPASGLYVPDVIIIPAEDRAEDDAQNYNTVICDGGETVILYRVNPYAHDPEIIRQEIERIQVDDLVQRVKADLSTAIKDQPFPKYFGAGKGFAGTWNSKNGHLNPIHVLKQYRSTGRT